MYSFRRTAYSASLKIKAEVPPKQQPSNPHSIVTQKTAILTTKILLQKVVVSKVLFNLARRIRGTRFHAAAHKIIKCKSITQQQT